MTSPSDKPQTFRKVTFTDGSLAKIFHNIDPRPGEPIIDRIECPQRKGAFRLEIIDEVLSVWQWHADFHVKAFEQAMTLPGGRVVCWRFRPQEACAVCLQSASSVIGKGLFDAPPTKPAPTTADDYRDAIRRAVTPEKLAATLGSLPAKSQQRIIERYLTEPPVRQTTKVTINRKSKP